jgi:xylulokinase
VTVPESGEYVANGAARQAAWLEIGGDEPPVWDYLATEDYSGAYDPEVRVRYNQAAQSYLD